MTTRSPTCTIYTHQLQHSLRPCIFLSRTRWPTHWFQEKSLVDINDNNGVIDFRNPFLMLPPYFRVSVSTIHGRDLILTIIPLKNRSISAVFVPKYYRPSKWYQTLLFCRRKNKLLCCLQLFQQAYIWWERKNRIHLPMRESSRPFATRYWPERTVNLANKVHLIVIINHQYD